MSKKARPFLRLLGLSSITVILLAASAYRSHAASQQKMNPLAAAKTIDDIFQKAVPIRLEAKPECSISLISDLAVGAEGRLIIADGWQSRGVFVFTREGKFIRELARRGQGPGEYQTPVSVEIGSDGSIWVADPMGNRILIYDRDYRFVRAILGQPRIPPFLHLGPGDEIFMYRSKSNPIRPDTSDTVFRYDYEGRKVSSMAPFPEEALKIDFASQTDGLDIDKDGFLYEMNPHFYRIRKYSPEGKLIASFARKTDLFRIMTKSGERPIIVNGPFYLVRGLVVAQVNKHIEIYDSGGRFIAGEIPFPAKILEADGHSLFAEADEGDDPGAENPKILVYSLR